MSALALRLRFVLNPLIAEAKRRARRRRLRSAAALTLLLAGGVLAAIARPHSPGASAASAATVSDGALRAALPPGWSASVGPGFYLTHPEAWVLLGNFGIPPAAARHEAPTSVPSGRVLVTIADFFPGSPSRNWRTVTSLGMPRALIATSRWWHVRYAGRALSIKATFGSGATDTLVNQVQRLLHGIQRVR